MVRFLRISRSGPILAVLMLSLAAGLAASWGAHGYLKGKVRQIELQHQQPQVERIVAAYDLPTGTKLDTDLLAIREFPADFVPSGSMAPIEAAELVGKVLLSDLRVGDMLVRAHARTADKGKFSQQLSKGRRALTMPVDSINSSSGLLAPGDMIDLYVSFDHQRRRITAPLLQGVRVLATGAETNAWDNSGLEIDSQSYATITLDTSPEDAVKLVAARQSGTITAMLRSPQDDGASQKAMRGDLASLLGLGASLPAEQKAQRTVVIYGNRNARAVPSLQAAPITPQAQGVFDLPVSVGLVSQPLALQRAEPLPSFIEDSGIDIAGVEYE